MKKILFVCTGNTCRSPMAEGLLKRQIDLNSKLKANFDVSSAGISVHSNSPAAANAVNVLLTDWGIDIRSHKARQATKDELAEAYLILTMERSHKAYLLQLFPELKHKIFTLKEFVSGYHSNSIPSDFNFSLDIKDPIGYPESVYRQTAWDIKTAVDKLVGHLKKSL